MLTRSAAKKNEPATIKEETDELKPAKAKPTELNPTEVKQVKAKHSDQKQSNQQQSNQKQSQSALTHQHLLVALELPLGAGSVFNICIKEGCKFQQYSHYRHPLFGIITGNGIKL